MKTQTAKQPNVIQQAHIDYLDALRASGMTNMFNAWQFLKTEFGVSTSMANAIFTHWMRHCN